MQQKTCCCFFSSETIAEIRRNIVNHLSLETMFTCVEGAGTITTADSIEVAL